MVSDLLSETKCFPVWVRLLDMCTGEFSALIARLMSECRWSGWTWLRGVKGIASSFPCCPVNCECSWKKQANMTLLSIVFWDNYFLLQWACNDQFSFILFKCISTSTILVKCLKLDFWQGSEYVLTCSNPYVTVFSL